MSAEAPPPDPYLVPPSNTVSDGDYVLLIFADNRHIFAQVLSSWRGKSPPLKINKKSYSTSNLIGLTYGTVLELDLKRGLVPLPDGEDVIPGDLSSIMDGEESIIELKQSLIERSCANDNRNLTDRSDSQKMTGEEILQMRSDPSISGSAIIKSIIQNSSTFESKTSFSKAKYIKKKQMKYQPRCRLTKCTASSVCRAMYLKDARKMLNLREDSLAQILSTSNVSAGCKVLCYDLCCGVVTGSLAQRMGGYGNIYSIYTGNAPCFVDLIARFNLNFVEHNSIKWLHAGQIFHDEVNKKMEGEIDYELMEREKMVWPCAFQPHTKKYVANMKDDTDRIAFLNKRQSRFSRKMTRPSSDEVLHSLQDGKKCDSLILACNYDPTHTLLTLLPYLETSCPFVVFFEYMEPLIDCFREVQKQGLAINLRLTDTWMREYQILPNRTHPNMNMSQNGGFILTGVKLCPVHGKNEIDDEIVKEYRRKIGRRGKKRSAESAGGNGKKRKNKKASVEGQ